MSVFITGATGNVGSAVLAELLAAGHSVSALARSTESAATLEQLGATPIRGDLGDLDLLRRSAEQSDGVTHLAFNHDFTRFATAIEEEAQAVTAFGQALAGSGRPLVIASGTPVVPGRPSTESDPPSMAGPAGDRGLNAQVVLNLAAQKIRSSVVRLPRTVHNQGKGGFAGILAAAAARSGVAGYPGDGTQRWPAVHSLDAAVLFRLALEQAEPGTVLHAVADEGDSVQSIVDVIGDRLDLPVQGVPAESFGPLGAVFSVDQPASSAVTKERFGWEPSHPSLLTDLAAHLGA